MKMAIALVLGLACTLAVSAQDIPPPPTHITNRGFEVPSILGGAPRSADAENWFYFASAPDGDGGITDARRKEGLQSFMFKAQKTEEAYQGVAQRFTATPGMKYVFSVYVMNDPVDLLVGEAYGQISIEWQDTTGVEVSRVYGPSWTSSLMPGEWKKFVIEVAAPANATMGVAVITFLSKQAAGRGTFYVDDCEFSSRAGGAQP